MKSNFYNVKVFLPVLLVFIASCAQQGSPVGGPEDVDPPKVVKSEPANYSANFEAERIMITFDEYLDMGNFTQELIVSPPMEEKPVVRLRNKTLIIDFEEELREDVTYTFNFGEGIKDLNERNILLNFEYVFSTGDKVDSLSIKGTLKNAFDLTIPENPIFIMLYERNLDSLPFKEIPIYVGRPDQEGNFAVNNLKAGDYKLFVLKDGNSNFLFDIPTEEIAFLDSTILVDGDYFRKKLLEDGVYDSTDLHPDTLALSIDTTGMSPDSVKMVLDSLDRLKPDFNSIYVDLFMFTEEDINQYISEYGRENREEINIVFNLPLTDSFSYRPVYPPSLTLENLIPEFGIERDSLILWAGDSTTAKFDTIAVEFQYTKLDSSGIPVSQIDTIQFSYREKEKKKKGAKEKEGKSTKGLEVKTVKRNGKQNPVKPLYFTVPGPLKSFDTRKIELYTVPDSVDVPAEIKIEKDSSNLHRIVGTVNWEEEARYHIILYPGAINDVYERTNDTIDRMFKVRPLADFGKIILNLEGVEDNVLIQIFNKDKIVQHKSVTESGSYTFDYLEPATYRVKFIHDRNANGKWDTGKYIEGIQPERVEYLHRDINVRAHWDHDVDYQMGSNDSPPSEEKKEEKNESLFQ